MDRLIKPAGLRRGDRVAVVSPCNGWAGDADIRWRYELGVQRLGEVGLEAIPAPNALRGSEYLARNPQARAEDILWAFENREIRAVIASVGGNDSIGLVPYLRPEPIREDPKIFLGYSDVMNLHLFCRKCGLSSFYGDNLLSPIAEAQGWHPYSKKWFQKVLFEAGPVGDIEPAAEWSCEAVEYANPNQVRRYFPNGGYTLLQGCGSVRGRLLGGHTGMMELDGTPLEFHESDFGGTILFLEDIPEFFTPECIEAFFLWLGIRGGLSRLKGIIIGRANENTDFSEQAACIIRSACNFGREELPILYGLNFGHSSPVCILPYGAMACIDCGSLAFSILESGVEIAG